MNNMGLQAECTSHSQVLTMMLFNKPYCIQACRGARMGQERLSSVQLGEGHELQLL